MSRWFDVKLPRMDATNVSLRGGTGPKGTGLGPRARDPCKRKACAKLAPAALVSFGERQLCADLSAPAPAWVLGLGPWAQARPSVAMYWPCLDLFPVLVKH